MAYRIDVNVQPPRNVNFASFTHLSKISGPLAAGLWVCPRHNL